MAARVAEADRVVPLVWGSFKVHRVAVSSSSVMEIYSFQTPYNVGVSGEENDYHCQGHA